MPIGDPRSIHQDKFTVVNDGSTTYSGVEKGEVSEGTHPEGYSDITEGIIVNVLKNGNIQMERWDTYRNEEILPKWVVKAPFDGSNFTYKNRNGLPAPSFKRKVQPIVSNIDSQSYTVTFPQATDNEVVHHYLVEVLEGEQVIASFRKFSQFYLNSQMPAELSQKLTELPEGKTLVVQVKAVDSYKNMSAPIISKPFFTSVSDTKPTARFAVLSDTHFGNSTSMTKVPQSLKVLFSKKPLVDAVFVVGDLTHRGKREEYEQLMSVFTDKSLIPEGVAIYFMMGNNHDNHDKTTGIEHYLEITKQPLHHYVDIKGFPFIAFSEGGSKLNEFNEEMKDWLAKTMADAATKYPGKPIFAFSHVSPENTCYGTLSSEGWGTDIFLPVYNQYPQTVVFGGHSHYPIGDPRSINQQVFTSINDGSSYYSEVAPGEVSMGIHPEGYGNVTEGLIVNVFPNSDIEIERWDTYRDKEIMPRWEIKAPHDGSRFGYKNYNGLPAPTFAASAKITGEQDGNSYKITFSQAADNDVVFRYFIELLDTAGKVVYSYTKFSQFYLNSDMPDELSHTFSDLPHGKTFIPRITAADSYNNLSKPLTGEVFTTPLQ
jgi:3',5'-cyclic AMP phosphodiesterase CpdA